MFTEGALGPRRGQLAAVERPDRAPRAAAAFHRRHALPIPSARGAARCQRREHAVRPLVRRQRRRRVRPAHRHRDVRVGETVLPTDGDGELWLNSLSPMRAAISPRTASSTARSMPRRSPAATSSSAPAPSGFSTCARRRSQPSVPGVEIHAQALEQMLSGEHLVRPPLATGAELSIPGRASALFVAGSSAGRAPVGAAVIGAAAILVVFAASWLAFTDAGYLLDPVYPSIALLARLSRRLAPRLHQHRERAQPRALRLRPLRRRAAGRGAGAQSDKLKLGGETREVTVLFADVRGFTASPRAWTPKS